MSTEKDTLNEKFAHLKASLEGMESVLVAFSGGVDSTLLLKVAQDLLGDKTLAVTAISQLTPRQESKDAREMAELIGATYLQVDSDDLTDPVFAANPKDKCYHCKKRRFGLLKQIASEKGLKFVVDGTNSDDFNDYRPGMKAIQELEIRSPLSEAGFSKDDIRRLSRQLGLPTWDKPAFACLASRVPYGYVITAEKLKQIDEAEIFLQSMGICRQVRVRHHGAVARLEVDPGTFHQFIDRQNRIKIADYFKKLGFQFVALDLEGYAMGSLNREILSKEGNQNG
jgi:pyridinium-3,5-biscarboxylic acid mononucleotide sulfurtransferase